MIVRPEQICLRIRYRHFRLVAGDGLGDGDRPVHADQVGLFDLRTDHIAHGIIADRAVNPLDRLDHMRVVADNDVRAGIVQLPGKASLLIVGFHGILRAPVHGCDDNIGDFIGPAHLGQQFLFPARVDIDQVFHAGRGVKAIAAICP